MPLCPLFRFGLHGLGAVLSAITTTKITAMRNSSAKSQNVPFVSAHSVYAPPRTLVRPVRALVREGIGRTGGRTGRTVRPYMLGFSKEHRDLNILRIGFVASEIAKAGGIALCANIAPYEEVRSQNRAIADGAGGYILVHVSTPLDVCEQRDRKGLYAKARAGVIKEFTGISDPYEVPTDADIELDTTDISPEEAAHQILLHLEKEGYITAFVG